MENNIKSSLERKYFGENSVALDLILDYTEKRRQGILEGEESLHEYH